jgi:phosphoserine phosphatase
MLTHETEQLHRRVESLGRILEVSRALATEIDLDHTLATVSTEACRSLDCDRATIFQYDPDSNELYTRATTELEIAEIRKPAHQGITGFVATQRKLAHIANPSSDPRWDSSIDRATGYHTRNILAAPLISPHDGSLLGVLQLLNKEGGDFDLLDEELLVAFAQHAAAALDRARLIASIKRQEATQASLSVAREVQRGFMPTRMPTLPGYEVGCWWFPNEAVGGDYCDVIHLPDGRTGFVIADVSGHGLGPALLMASVRAALKALVLEHTSAEVLLNLLGHALNDDLQEGRFITMVLAALDTNNHRVEYANAGHAPALHFMAADNRFAPLEATGMPLGVIERPVYPQGPPLALAAGDVLLLCTDGIVEAMDEQFRPFGSDRLNQIVSRHHGDGVQPLVEQIGAQVSAHYVGESPPDDLTILAVRRLP